MRRPALSYWVFGFALFVLGTGCSHAPQNNPTPNEVLQSKEDLRFKLAQLTLALGEPLPPPAPDDPLGIESLPGHAKRVFALKPMRFHNVETRIRLTSWKNRVHTLELSFPKGCDTTCASIIMEMMNEWLAAPPPQRQGNAHTQSVQMDTVLFTFEWFPEKTDVSRLIIQCRPLYAAAHHRPSRLPGIGQSIAIEKMPRCRPLMP